VPERGEVLLAGREKPFDGGEVRLASVLVANGAEVKFLGSECRGASARAMISGSPKAKPAGGFWPTGTRPYGDSKF
jgi:hypothetical protein